MEKIGVRLDWSRLLGFDLVDADRSRRAAVAAGSGRVDAKLDLENGPVSARIGAKIGGKQAATPLPRD